MSNSDTFINLSYLDLIGKVIFVYGPRLSGKTELCKYLLNMIKDNSTDPIFLIVNGNHKAVRTYKSITDPDYIHQKYSKDLTMRYVKSLQNEVDDPKVLLLEDCLWNDDWLKDTSIQFLFRQGKSSNFTTILCASKPLKITSSLLHGVDYYFAAADHTSLRTLTNSYGLTDHSYIQQRIGKEFAEHDFIFLNKNIVGTFRVHLNHDAQIVMIQRTIRRFLAQKRAKEYIQLQKKQIVKQKIVKQIEESGIEIKSFNPHVSELYQKLVVIDGNISTGKTEIIKYLVETIKKQHGELDLHVYSHELKKYNYMNPTVVSESFNQDLMKNATNSIIVMDSVLHGIKWMKSKFLRSLFANKKEKNITIIMTVPYLTTFTPLVKENIDYVFVSRTDKIKKYYDQYGQFIEYETTNKKDLFGNIFKTVTSKFNFIVFGIESAELIKITWFDSHKQRLNGENDLDEIKVLLDRQQEDRKDRQQEDQQKKDLLIIKEIPQQSVHSKASEDHVPEAIPLI